MSIRRRRRVSRIGTEAQDYLRANPRLMKWINICVTCGTTGHKPELPLVITRNRELSTVVADNLRRYFNAMPLDDVGRCEMCAGATT